MPNYYAFKVTVTGIAPPITRRFLLRITAKFGDLHHAIRAAFGWQTEARWEFRSSHTGPVIAEPSDAGDLYLEDVGAAPDAHRTRLKVWFGDPVEQHGCVYISDLGDDWRHDVVLEGVVHDADTFQRRLVGGERACPPSDCGGVDGYQRCVAWFETGDDPWGEDPLDVEEWLGDWNPEDFELEDVAATFDR